ncbi:circadian clock protein KaiC [Roseospirillum parvum]|uniref:non-specific serine/threonine protein kinase n=1 Tax=Roseospirillum parvum TaxID=83401 RepID=A0A1G8AIQ0_9PROT|nr:circadian clock protein KaiC [Roseospirillum parvum]SDH20757.1 circadian clock protein KaiC [Roseospirillum parvum]
MGFSQVSTGVPGLDAILSGGYLKASPTLIMGQPGCGKTLFLLQFLADGAARGERSVCATCTESPERLHEYMGALGHPVDQWSAEGLFSIVDLRPVPGEVVTGSLDQTVVKVRLDAALAAGGADPSAGRLAIDELNRLAYAFDSAGVAREQTLALLRELRDSRITTLISSADTTAARDSLMDYAADAVIELRQTIEHRLMTRTLRVTKMRGVPHGTNEYPFMIDQQGPSLMPITNTEGHHRSRQGMVSTGHARLDPLLGGGLYRGGSLMITGTSGSGKTTLCGQLANGLCGGGLKVTYLTFEQDESELRHDYEGVGINVAPHLDAGRLNFVRARSVDCGLEEHLIRLARMIQTERPDALIIDAVTSMTDLGDPQAVKSMLLRLVDTCKSQGVLIVMIELLGDAQNSVSEMGLSSLLDTWIRLELHRQDGEYVRLVRVLKSRGANASQQIKEFRITDQGIVIEDPYVGQGSFVFGTEKLLREQADARDLEIKNRRLTRLREELALLPNTFEAQLAQTRIERDRALDSLKSEIDDLEQSIRATTHDARALSAARGGGA